MGSAVISGALSEIYHNQKKSLTDQLILRPFPQGDDAKAMWEAYRQDMISYSGISIFLLGNKKENGITVLSNGMWSEYEISKNIFWNIFQTMVDTQKESNRFLCCFLFVY